MSGSAGTPPVPVPERPPAGGAGHGPDRRVGGRRPTPVRPVPIVFVIDNIGFRGGERTFLQLAERLDRRRYEVAVACSPEGVFVDRLHEIGIPVIAADMRRKWRLDTVLALARTLRRRRPRIVHTQGRGDPFGRIAARLARVPAVISTTAMISGRYDVPEPWRRALYRVIDRVTDPLVDRFIVVNRGSVPALVERHGVPPGRIAVIPNGIELDRYDPGRVERGAWRRRLRVPDDAVLIGALGRLTRQKGFDELIQAFPPLATRGVRLVIGGEGEDRRGLEARVETLGLQRACFLPGFVEDVPGFLADLDLFVLPSRIEGHPMVLLEAMAMGRAVVATDLPGVGDTITDGVDGRLVPPGDRTALAEALAELAAAPGRARGLGRNARRTVEREYTVERMVARTAALYDSVLGTR